MKLRSTGSALLSAGHLENLTPEPKKIKDTKDENIFLSMMVFTAALNYLKFIFCEPGKVTLDI